MQKSSESDIISPRSRTSDLVWIIEGAATLIRKEMNYYRSGGVISDFQKRAKNYEKKSRFVADEDILSVPLKYLLSRKTAGNLLDAGGGTGYLSHFLSKHIEFESIYLVDICDDMLKEAERKNYGAKIFNSSIESFCEEAMEKFDTILIRQVLHYVEDVNKIFLLLKSVLKTGGLIYVGQYLRTDNDCREWHYELAKEISKNRHRTMRHKEFLEYVCQNGLEVIQNDTTEIERSLEDFYENRIDNNLSFKELMNKMIALTSESVKDKMRIRITDSNIYYSAQFCHFLLKKKETCNNFSKENGRI